MFALNVYIIKLTMFYKIIKASISSKPPCNHYKL